MAPGEEFDSGMESQEGSAKDVTPEKKPEIEDNYEDEVNDNTIIIKLHLTSVTPILYQISCYHFNCMLYFRYLTSLIFVFL